MVIHPAAYSRAELEAQAAKIDKVAKGTDIQQIVLPGDGSGIIVEKQPPGIATATPTNALSGAAAASPSTAKKLPAESAVAAAQVSVPVTVTVATSGLSSGSRLSDSSPWNSGDLLERYSSDLSLLGWCTTGFAVWLNGQTYLLTAWHCTQGTANYYDNAHHFIGNPGPQWGPIHDLALVNARGYYWMFDGYNPVLLTDGRLVDGSSTRKTVHSWDYAIGNESVCQSGATSGTRCWLQTGTSSTFSYYDPSTGQTYYDLSSACRTQDSRPAGQPGDSGGPIFTLDGNGVRAKGIFSGYDFNGNCIYFQDMRYITWTHGSWTGVTPRTA